MGDPVIVDFIKRNLKNMSPDALSGRIKVEKPGITVSHESIYKIIFKDFYYGGDLWKLLPRKKKRRKKQRKIKDSRGAIKNKTPIAVRPESINSREEKGHYELDTVVGKSHKGVILTLTERKTNFSFAHKMPSKEARYITNQIISCKRMLGRLFKSATVDNGLEFSEHELITKATNIKIYFADPCSPWQRGTNEHWNGLLRKYIPKGTDIRKIPQSTIDKYTNKINNMPRKKYGYRSSYEMFFGANVAMLI